MMLPAAVSGDDLLTEGTSVEVWAVWASNGSDYPPSFTWMGGYTFIRYEPTDRTCTVMRSDGPLAGCLSRHAVPHVRRKA